MTCHSANVGDEEPGLGAGDVFLPILGHSTAASKPCEGSFDDPAAGDDFEALGRVATLDDLDGPFAELLRGISQLWPAVAATCEDVAQQRMGPGDGFQQTRRAVAMLHIGTMNGEADQQTDGIGHNVALATLDPFARIIAATPPLSVVLTLWLSITPAVGLAERPSA
jgi:hypothetical protein